MRIRLVMSILCLLGPLAACSSPFGEGGAARMRAVSTEDLCQWAWNPLSGAQMRRELARRGAECEAGDPSGPAASHLTGRPPPVGPAAPPPGTGTGAQEPILPASRAEPPQVPTAARPARAAADPAATAGEAAPLVTSFCAARVLREGSTGEAGSGQAVVFSNTCGIPIKVRFAERGGGRLTGQTALLRPGETSRPAAIEAGADPTYIVCRYDQAPEARACRPPLDRSGGLAESGTTPGAGVAPAGP